VLRDVCACLSKKKVKKSLLWARGQPYRRVAANWDRSRSQRGAEGGGTGASGARTTLPTTDYDGASKHLGNAFATHPLFFKIRINLRAAPHLAFGSPFKRYARLGSRLTRFDRRLQVLK
jgi:hypothetical protein